MSEEQNIVKKVCKELNITQAELARQLEVSPATISDWAKGNIPKMAEMALLLILENKCLILDQVGPYISNTIGLLFTLRDL